MPKLPEFPPREAASEPCPIGGAHPVIDLATLAGEVTVPANLEVLALLVSSAQDEPVGCLPCQARHLDTVAADPSTTGFLVEMTGCLIAEVGAAVGLPAGTMLGAAGIPPVLSDLWTFAAGAGGYPAMYEHLATLDDAERREIGSDALDLFVGQFEMVRAGIVPSAYRPG